MKNMTFTRAELRAFVLGRVDHLEQVGPMLAMIDDWRGFLDSVIR